MPDEEQPEPVPDDLADAVPGRVSDAADEQGGRATVESRPPAAAVLVLGLVVAAVAVLALVLVRAGGPGPSPEELARRPLNPRPTAPATGLALAGKPLFESNCARCHGTQGDVGTAPSLRARRVALVPDSVIVAVIRQGLPRMPPVPLSPEGERAVVAYVRYLEGFPPSG